MKGKRREKNSSLKKYIVAARYDGMELEQYLKEVDWVLLASMLFTSTPLGRAFIVPGPS